MSESVSARVIDTEAITIFASDRDQVQVLLDSEDVTTRLLCLEPGQSVGPCTVECLMLYYVLEGRGRLRLNDDQDTSSLVTGALAIVPAGAERGIAAQEQMRVLAVQMHHGEAAFA